LASFVLLYQIIEEGRPARTWKLLMAQIPSLYGLAPLMVVGAAFLMVSTIPYPAFKQSGVVRPRSAWRILGIVAAVAVVFAYPQTAAFVVFFAYTLLGPVGSLVRLARRLLRISPHPPQGQPGSAP
jgi:phosphatidylserine synthase